MSDRDDGRIIIAVLAGDKDAFGVLVRRYQRPIYNLMYRASGSADEAADLTQEAFIKAYEKLELFKPGRKFFTWLYTIGLNHARDHIRKKKPGMIAEGIEVDHQSGLDNPGEQQERLVERLDAGRLSEAVSLLPLDYQVAVVLRYQQDLPMNEIAEILGITVSGVKMRIHRALKKLRDILTGEEGHEQ